MAHYNKGLFAGLRVPESLWLVGSEAISFWVAGLRCWAYCDQ